MEQGRRSINDGECAEEMSRHSEMHRKEKEYTHRDAERVSARVRETQRGKGDPEKMRDTE